MRIILIASLELALLCGVTAPLASDISFKWGIACLAFLFGWLFVECLLEEIDGRIKAAVNKKRRKR